MIISDLNYLENTSEEVFGGRGRGSSKVPASAPSLFPSFTEILIVAKAVGVNVTILGNLATANAGANASGANTLTQTATTSATTNHSSSSGSSSLAGTGYNYYS
ncbi:hypothetical protein [Nostoc sp.]|uniref:hypothetical protein n=1 Tax=Nostoc sp. TaxID=1180 RepID=UPI002FFB6221